MLVRVSLASLAAAVFAALALPLAAIGAVNGRIAFQAFPKPNRVCTQHHPCFPQIYTIEPDGSGLTQITQVPKKDPGAENPIWSPNGATLAFDSASGSGVNLFTVPAGGGTPTQLPLSVGRFNGDPAYSVDGTHISFDQDIGPSQPKVHGIFIADSNGANARRVTTGIGTVQAFDTESQWSPDGTRLAFTRVKNDRRAAIFTVNVDGTGLKRLTPYKLDAASPDWSPDGSTIAFNSYWDSPGGKPSNILTIPAGGGHRTALTHDHGGHIISFRPSWSPDGTRIVFTRIKVIGHHGRTNLFSMTPSGSDLEQITHMSRGFPTNPDWGTAP
jgi:Tol biopolymer transport system component